MKVVDAFERVKERFCLAAANQVGSTGISYGHRASLLLVTHKVPLLELERRLASLGLAVGFYVFDLPDYKETHIQYKNPNMMEIDNIES